MGYRLTRRAEQDIAALYVEGSDQFGAIAAADYHSGLVEIFGLIAQTPLMARERFEFYPAVRFHPYRAHMIVYLIDSQGVLIVRVLHGRQDWGLHL